MRHAPLTTLSLLAVLVTVAACDQPKWRDTSAQPPGAKAPAPQKNQVDPGGTPAAPAWAQAVIGKNLRAAFPKSGICRGNTDIVQRKYAGAPAGVQIHGWGWDVGRKARIERVVLVDKTFRIVGAGEGGISRPDVPTAVPEITDQTTGWNTNVAVTAGPLDSYGVTGDNSVCVLGHIEF